MTQNGLKNGWIDRQAGSRVRLKSQRQALKVAVHTPHGLLELVSIKERSKTDGGTLVIYPKLEKNISLPFFTQKISQKDIHFSVYPNLRTKDQCRVHLSIKGREESSGIDASVDFMHKINAPERKFCFPMYGMIAPYLDDLQRSVVQPKHQYVYLPSYQPNVCSIVFCVVVTSKHDALEIPNGFSCKRLLFKFFSVHLLYSYINCPSAFQTSFFAPPNDTLRVKFGEKERMRPAIPPTIEVPINSYRAVSEGDQFDISTASSSIEMALAFGAFSHFSKAVEAYEKNDVLIGGESPRAWFFNHCNEYHPNPITRKHNLSETTKNLAE